jgi:electron transport complex protein RnfA
MRDTAPGFPLACGIVLALTATLAWMVDHWLLAPFGLGYLRTLALVLVAGALAQLALVAMKQSFDLDLALASTSFTVFAIVFLPARPTMAGTALQGIAAGAGLAIAMILFTAMRQRIDAADVPAPFRGAPIALLTAGLMALAFLGLSGRGAG